MLYHIIHTTRYKYTDPVSLCQNLAHLTPREVPEQHCLETALTIDPEPAVLSPRVDYFGNPATFFTIQEPHRQITLTATHQIEVFPRQAPDPLQSPPWETVRERLPVEHSAAALEAFQFVVGSRYAQPGAAYAAYAEPSFTPGRPLLDAALDLTRRIHQDFVYDPKATNLATPLQEVLTKRRGVCQDFAHLQIACLRSLGLATRYVSGYLCTNPPAGQPRLVGADATHAWLAVYCPVNGWVDLDPTNNQIPTDQHVLLAWGRDYDDVSPIKGVILGGGRHVMSVGVTVSPDKNGHGPLCDPGVEDAAEEPLE